MQAAGLGLAALAVPGWIAFQRSEADGLPRGPLEDAWQVARERGRPLFVLLAERNGASDHTIGLLLGTFLLHASAEQLAPLATCEIACATTNELNRLAPHFSPRAVRAVVLWPDDTVTCAVSGTPPELVWPNWDDESNDHVDSLRAQHAWLSEQLTAAFEADPFLAQRLARIELERKGAAPASAPPSIDFARDWPCAAFLRSRREPEGRADWEQALASAARERWSVEAPAGSTWARSGGCGVLYEHPPRRELGVISCGMGLVHPFSNRFLHFYTAAERPD